MALPELTNENVRKGMENGWCFAVSHYSNGVELNGMEEMPGFDEDKVYDTEAYLRDDTPLVTRVTVDDENDTISIEGENFNSITWVSNCNVIKRETDIDSGKATLDLRADDLLDMSDSISRATTASAILSPSLSEETARTSAMSEFREPTTSRPPCAPQLQCSTGLISSSIPLSGRSSISSSATMFSIISSTHIDLRRIYK